MNQITDKSPGKILIVDDVPDNLRLLSTTLSKEGYRIRCAKNGMIALMGALNDLPDLILLDINMPDLNGYQVCKKLKTDPRTQNIPIIFLSAQDDIQDKVKAFTMGGADFIGKPFQVEEVLARVQNQLALQLAHSEIRTLNEALEKRVEERTSQIELANQELKQEIAQRHQLEQRLRHDALHDSLTGLPNRIMLMQRVEKCLDDAIENNEVQFAILFIDLDRFKIINDSLGHIAGDKLLVACAARLKTCLTAAATIARLGGDEFTILLEQIKDLNDAVEVAEEILHQFATPFKLNNRSLSITISIGIAIGSAAYAQETDLLRDADIAMYRAKELGKGRYEIFTEQMYFDMMRRLEIEHELREAIANQELVLHYQPIISLDDQKLKGFEALVRWQHPQRGLISPGEFVPLAEETGLVVPLGKWVMYEACSQLQKWQELCPAAHDLTMSINVAGEQLNDANFLATVDHIIETTQVKSSCLKLEITESMLIEDTKQIMGLLEQVKSRQIELSIDDFGTGYSSLSYLPQFSVDNLKIDRSFVEAMNLEQQNLEIVKTIVTLAQVLELQIIAEGIETDEQSQTLKSLGVEFGQGYLFSKPLTSEQAELLITDY
ncbi:MAG: EAL domain-containing protein [Cyanobacteria bacterium J06621_12]